MAGCVQAVRVPVNTEFILDLRLRASQAHTWPPPVICVVAYPASLLHVQPCQLSHHPGPHTYIHTLTHPITHMHTHART